MALRLAQRLVKAQTPFLCRVSVQKMKMSKGNVLKTKNYIIENMPWILLDQNLMYFKHSRFYHTELPYVGNQGEK